MLCIGRLSKIFFFFYFFLDYIYSSLYIQFLLIIQQHLLIHNILSIFLLHQSELDVFRATNSGTGHVQLSMGEHLSNVELLTAASEYHYSLPVYATRHQHF